MNRKHLLAFNAQIVPIERGAHNQSFQEYQEFFRNPRSPQSDWLITSTPIQLIWKLKFQAGSWANTYVFSFDASWLTQDVDSSSGWTSSRQADAPNSLEQTTEISRLAGAAEIESSHSPASTRHFDTATNHDPQPSADQALEGSFIDQLETELMLAWA